MQVRTAKDLGAAIRQARIRRRLTQAALASKLGIDQARISQIERGATGVAVGAILRIFTALDIMVTIADDGTGPDSRRRAAKKDRESVDLDAIANTGLGPWPTKR
jgi:HTH-type transcriptional regulator/antitoxin HipB